MIVQLSVLFQYSVDRSFRVHFYLFISLSQREKQAKGLWSTIVLAPLPLKIKRVATRGRRKVDRYRGMGGREADEKAGSVRPGEIFQLGSFL